MDIFRTFDALNDYRNFQTVVPVKSKNAACTSRAVSATPLTEPRLGGEVYNVDYFVNKGQGIWRRWGPTASASRIWPA
jgi:pyruvate carboxylase subunit B